MSAFTYQKGDVLGFAIDMTDAINPVISVYKNGQLYHVSSLSNSGSDDLIPFATLGSAGVIGGEATSALAAVTFNTIPETIIHDIPEGFEALELTGPLEKIQYLSTSGFITEPSNFPANQTYEDDVFNIPILKRSLDTSFTGGITQSYGEITIGNLDYTKDDWLDRSWNGREVKLLIGSPVWNLADYRNLARGISHELVSPDYNNLALKVRDKSGELNRPIKLRKFFGDSYEYSSYIEGSEGEYETLYNAGVAEGQFIPIAYGECYQVPAVLIDAAELIYQVHDGPISQVVAVYDKGLAVDFTGIEREGKFQLHAQPVGTITADIHGAKFTGFNAQDKVVGNYFPWGDHHSLANTTNGTLDSPTSTVTNSSSTGHYKAFSEVGHNSGKFAVTFELTDMDTGADIRIGVSNGLYSSLSGYLGSATAEWALSMDGNKLTEGVTTTSFMSALSESDKITLEINMDDKEIYYRVNNGSSVQVWDSTDLADLNNCFIGVSVGKGTNPTTVTVDGSFTWYNYNFPYSGLWNELTVGGKRGAPSYYNDPTNIIYDILNTWSYLDNEWINFDSLSDFYNNNSQEMGIWINNPRSAADIISEITRSYLAFWGFNRLGNFELKNLQAPENGTVSNSVVINQDEVRFEGINVKLRIIPTNKIDIGYRKFYKTLTEAEMAGIFQDAKSSGNNDNLTYISITPNPNGSGNIITFGKPEPEEQADLSKEYRIETLPNRYTKIKHKLSQESAQLNTVLVNKYDATKLARARMDIFGQLRTVHTFRIMKTGFNLSIGDIIEIDNPRFGFSGGKQCLIVGLDESFDPPQTTLEVFV